MLTAPGCRIRDHQFELLIQPHHGTTPLVHAMRQRSKDMAIVITGAISRRVNQLTDEADEQASGGSSGGTVARQLQQAHSSELRSIRATLRLALAHGLANDQTDLCASYLQVVVMSEGARFVRGAASDVALALRSTPATTASEARGGGAGAVEEERKRPVESAYKLVTRWASKELKDAFLLASVADYVANSTWDILLFALWNTVAEIVQPNASPGSVDDLPTHLFARDDRVARYVALTALERRQRY